MHVRDCGNRTELCFKCNKYIPLKGKKYTDYEHHQQFVDCMPKLAEPPAVPKVQRNPRYEVPSVREIPPATDTRMQRQPKYEVSKVQNVPDIPSLASIPNIQTAARRNQEERKAQPIAKSMELNRPARNPGALNKQKLREDLGKRKEDLNVARNQPAKPVSIPTRPAVPASRPIPKPNEASIRRPQPQLDHVSRQNRPINKEVRNLHLEKEQRDLELAFRIQREHEMMLAQSDQYIAESLSDQEFPPPNPPDVYEDFYPEDYQSYMYDFDEGPSRNRIVPQNPPAVPDYDEDLKRAVEESLKLSYSGPGDVVDISEEDQILNAAIMESLKNR